MSQPTWTDVLSFLQKQHNQLITLKSSHNLQIQVLNKKISTLQNTLDSNRQMISSLYDRIKVLQIMLLKYKNKNQLTIPKNQLDNIQQLISKLNPDINNKINYQIQNQPFKFINQIFNDMSISIKSNQIKQISKIQDLNVNKQFLNLNNKNKQYKLIQQTSVHLDTIRDFCVSQNNQFIITVSQDCLIRINDYNQILGNNKNKQINKQDNKKNSRIIRQHTGPIFAITGNQNIINKNQYIFYTGGTQSLIKQHKILNKQTICTNTLQLPSSNSQQIIWSLKLNKNNLLASISDNNNSLVALYETNNKDKKPQIFKYKQYTPTDINWINQNCFIQGLVQIPRGILWDINVKKIVRNYIYQPIKNTDSRINSLISYNSKVILGCQDGNLRLYSQNTQKQLKKIQFKSPIIKVKQFNNNNILICTSQNIYVYDIRNYAKINQIQIIKNKKGQQGIVCIWGSSNGQNIISAGSDAIIRSFKLI